MTTLPAPQLADSSPEDLAILERVAKRMGRSAEQLLQPGIFGVQTHWPAWLEANFDHRLATYLRPGHLPPLVKEAMHVAVSMTNRWVVDGSIFPSSGAVHPALTIMANALRVGDHLKQRLA